MSAAALQSQFERLSVNNIGNIAKKQATTKAKEKFAVKEAVNEALGMTSGPKAPRHKPEASEKQVKAFANRMDEAVKERNVQARDKVRIDKYRRTVRYFELTPDMCVGLKKPSLTATEQELDTLLAEVHGRFGGKGAKLVIDMGLITLFKGIEFVCESYGLGPTLGLETGGLGAAMMVAMQDPGFLQPERTEAYIENAGRFEQPWWIRLGLKMGQTAVAFSEGKKNARLGNNLQQPVSDEARKKYADM
jgi:hypothetical protein